MVREDRRATPGGRGRASAGVGSATRVLVPVVALAPRIGLELGRTGAQVEIDALEREADFRVESLPAGLELVHLLQSTRCVRTVRWRGRPNYCQSVAVHNGIPLHDCSRLVTDCPIESIDQYWSSSLVTMTMRDIF